MADLQAARRDPLRLFRRHEFGLLLAILLVVGVTTLFDSQHNYFHDPWRNAREIMRQTSLLGIFALGSAVVIISGGIDLSSGSVICFSGTICATFLLLLAPDRMHGGEAVIGLPVLAVAIVGTLIIGFLIGSLHAWLITAIRLPPFIATLATLVGLRSFAWAICENVTQATLGGRSSQIQIYDERFRYLATSVWIPAVLFVVFALAAWVMLSRTVLGRHLYALGGNEEAARLSGVRIDRLRWFAYCFSAVLSSIAGILYICEVSVADPTTLGLGYELNAIAAAVVGGCSLQGGVGTIGGTVLGTIFLRTVIDGVAKVIKTGSRVYEGLIVGLVVVFAVAFSQTARLRGREGFFAGALGFVAAINLALIFGVIMVLVGPTLAEGWTTLDGPILGAWAGASILAMLLVLRSRLGAQSRWIGTLGVAVVLIGIYFGLDRGVPLYRLHAARASVQAAGGKIDMHAAEGVRVDLGGTQVDDATLKQLADRLQALHVADLSLARTKVTDDGIGVIGGLTTLKRLDLSGTQVTRAGTRSVTRLLPDVEVIQ
ncbi:MAG TPA: ABC transporter permease [Planctomycetaceae bacterium]|jgi:ribose/xylose/arabinose/galactoside ABC-type transport system permease subunit|nr:ABC transporter permease [Planctomycetaceae bacterium]